MGEILGGFIVGFIAAVMLFSAVLKDYESINKDDTGKLWCSYKGSVYTLSLVDLEKEETK